MASSRRRRQGKRGIGKRDSFFFWGSSLFGGVGLEFKSIGATYTSLKKSEKEGKQIFLGPGNDAISFTSKAGKVARREKRRISVQKSSERTVKNVPQFLPEESRNALEPGAKEELRVHQLKKPQRRKEKLLRWPT